VRSPPPPSRAQQVSDLQKEQGLGRLNVLKEGLERTQAYHGAADPQAVVVAGEVERVSYVPEFVRSAVPAFGAGLLLAVGIVLLLEFGTRHPRQDAAHRDGPVDARVRQIPYVRQPAPP
jgi:hypothetical protein